METLEEFRNGAWEFFIGQAPSQVEQREDSARILEGARNLGEKNSVLPSYREKAADRELAEKIEQLGDFRKGGYEELISAPPAVPTTEEGRRELEAQQTSAAQMMRPDSSQADFKGLPGSRANNPLATAPAVRKSMASTATNRDILPGGEVVEDEEGWSYQRLPNGSVQIVTAPESNKTSVGMILTDKSTGDNKTYYNAISEYVSSKLDNPAAEDEPEEIQQYREGKITPEYRDSLLAAQSEQNPNAIQQMTDVEPVETPMASDKDVAKAGRAMGRRRKVQKAKDIAQRLIDRNVGGMGESF
jgi:hypothetical protein